MLCCFCERHRDYLYSLSLSVWYLYQPLHIYARLCVCESLGRRLPSSIQLAEGFPSSKKLNPGRSQKTGCSFCPRFPESKVSTRGKVSRTRGNVVRTRGKVSRTRGKVPRSRENELGKTNSGKGFTNSGNRNPTPKPGTQLGGRFAELGRGNELGETNSGKRTRGKVS